VIFVAWRAQGWRSIVGVGLLGGLALLTRPEAAVVVLAALGILVGRRLPRAAIAAALLVALCCLPYGLYYHRHQGGLFILGKAQANGMVAPRLLAGVGWKDFGHGAAARASEITHFASPWRRVPENLSATVPFLAERYPLLIAGAVLALGALIRRREQRVAAAAVIAVSLPSAIAHLYFVVPRFLLPAEAALCAFGVAGWWWAAGRRRWAQIALAVALPASVAVSWWHYPFNEGRPVPQRGELLRVLEQLREMPPPGGRPLRIASNSLLPAFYADGQYIYVSPYRSAKDACRHAWSEGADVVVLNVHGRPGTPLLTQRAPVEEADPAAGRPARVIWSPGH